jgi:mono/diheme cytochrome c family protein
MRVLAAWDWHRFTRFDVWGVLFWINTIAIVALVIISVVVLVRDRQERPAPNAVAFLEDDALETRRLERVLGWALVFSAVLAVSYGVYWLREPDRQRASEDYFADGAIERGEVLFANEQFESFDGATSLKCADCHGGPGESELLGREVVGAGGSAPYTYKDPTRTTDDGKAVAFNVAWRAPALNTVMYRFSPQEVREIITFGRPGTPMQPWGVDGNGPKNAQSVDDLVAYLASIQLSPEEAQQQAAADFEAAEGAAAKQLADAKIGVETATSDLEAAEEAFAAVPDPDSNEGQLKERAVAAAKEKLRIANARLDWAQAWSERRKGISDGQLLFELNCARCHTNNWSVFDPSNPNLLPEDLLGQAGAGGSLGFNLLDAPTIRFTDGLDADGNPAAGSGRTAQNVFVTNGSEKNQPYGVGGNGSGRMPGQCNSDFFADFARGGNGTELQILEHSGCMLTPEQIEEIVAYERCGLAATKRDFGAADYDPDCG